MKDHHIFPCLFSHADIKLSGFSAGPGEVSPGPYPPANLRPQISKEAITCYQWAPASDAEDDSTHYIHKGVMLHDGLVNVTVQPSKVSLSWFLGLDGNKWFSKGVLLFWKTIRSRDSLLNPQTSILPPQGELGCWQRSLMPEGFVFITKASTVWVTTAASHHLVGKFVFMTWSQLSSYSFNATFDSDI